MAQVLVFHQTAKYTEDAVTSVMEQFGAWQDSHPTWQVVQVNGALAGGETWCSYALTVLFGVPEEQAEQRGKCNTCGASLDQPSVLCAECWANAARKADQGPVCPNCLDEPVTVEGRWCQGCAANFEARR